MNSCGGLVHSGLEFSRRDFSFLDERDGGAPARRRVSVAPRQHSLRDTLEKLLRFLNYNINNSRFQAKILFLPQDRKNCRFFKVNELLTPSSFLEYLVL